jgi:thiamine-monophosphate kinase
MTRKAQKRPGEFALIERYFRPLATDPAALELRDDAALYPQRPGDDLVITADMIVAGVHFFADDPPDLIARKALRVNLSDLAGKGAEPFGYLLSLGLPSNWTETWIKRFTAGLAADQKQYGVHLLGGDTTRLAGGLTIAITALGRTEKGQMVRRSGAKPGDIVFVSGTIGDGALGLRVRQGHLARRMKYAGHLLDRYLLPQPRIALAPVVRRFASAAIDVSDGLVGDLTHICDVSGVGAEIEAEFVPLSPGADAVLTADVRMLPVILNGGDDYEILATVSPANADPFTAAAKAAGVAVSRIGEILTGKGPAVVRDANGKVLKLTTKSHTHF